MFLVVFTTTLATILILIIIAASYLISLICEESDDSNSAESLALNSHDFTTNPTISPIDRANHAKRKADRPNSNSLKSEESKQAILELAPMAATDILTKEAFTRSVDSASSRRLETNLAEDEQSWDSSPVTQKNIIANQLGEPASKQLFDDFDAKEMQLGGTGLHWCKTRKSLDKLINLGLPINITNKRGETPIHVAVRRGKLQVLIGLLCREASIECRNENGETPLLLACKVNDIYACQLLLIFDADVNAADNLGRSARHHVAGICDRNRGQQSPNAAHLILAMLDDFGAGRCPERNELIDPPTAELSDKPGGLVCSDGCSRSGAYNGNSYNRWPNFQRESLYKRHMFADIIEASKRAKAEPTARKSKAEPRESRLLCIDGGGMRGVIVCQIMIELEKYLERPMISYFDWIGGTSVGGFLACALCNGASLPELRRICFDVKDEVFHGQKPYSSKFIERVLKRTLGETTRMSRVTDKKLAVTTVIADRDPCQLRFFRNYKSASQLLELHGFPAATYNNLSAHSIVSRRHSVTRKSISGIISQTNVRRSNQSQKAPRGAQSSQSRDSKAARSDGKPTGSNDGASSDKQLGADSNEDTGSDNSSDSVVAENEQDPLMWQAVRASAAAPFFFKPYGPYLDGGIISNNPTLDMLTEFQTYERAKRFLRAKNVSPLRISSKSEECHDLAAANLKLVVSLGTGRGRVVGRQSMLDFSLFNSGFSTVFSPVELLRSIRAARDLFKKLMQQACQTEDHVLDRAQAWCSSLEIPYFRVNPPLASLFSIDDKRDEQLINALWQTKLYMRAMSGQLKELAELLDGPIRQRCTCQLE